MLACTFATDQGRTRKSALYERDVNHSLCTVSDNSESQSSLAYEHPRFITGPRQAYIRPWFSTNLPHISRPILLNHLLPTHAQKKQRLARETRVDSTDHCHLRTSTYSAKFCMLSDGEIESIVVACFFVIAITFWSIYACLGERRRRKEASVEAAHAPTPGMSVGV